MIRLALEIEGGKIELTMEGAGSKAELLSCIGVLEDLKFKILSSTQDDDSGIIFSFKQEKKKDGTI